MNTVATLCTDRRKADPVFGVQTDVLVKKRLMPTNWSIKIIHEKTQTFAMSSPSMNLPEVSQNCRLGEVAHAEATHFGQDGHRLLSPDTPHGKWLRIGHVWRKVS
jgi:hypothetical protein